MTQKPGKERLPLRARFGIAAIVAGTLTDLAGVGYFAAANMRAEKAVDTCHEQNPREHCFAPVKELDKAIAGVGTSILGVATVGLGALALGSAGKKKPQEPSAS